MEGLIGFGKISIKLIFPFLGSLSRNLRIVIFHVLEISSKLKQYPLLISIFMSFSQILGGLLIFAFFSLKQWRQMHEAYTYILKNEKILLDQFKLQNKPKKLTLKSSSILLLITVVNIIETIATEFMNQYVSKDITNLIYQLKIMNIFFIAAFSIFILRYRLFCHHYCSIAIIVFGLVFLLFQSFQVYQVDWYITVILFVCSSLVSVQKVCESYLMHYEYEYFNPYRILLYEGIIGLVISIVIEIVLSFIPCPTDWFCEGNSSIENPLIAFRDFDSGMFFYILFYVLFAGNISIWSTLTNQYFTPAHLVISDIFSAFLYWCMNFYYQNGQPFSNSFISMSLIGFIITMFGAFMYTEIVIVHACGLDDNTGRRAYYYAKSTFW